MISFLLYHYIKLEKKMKIFQSIQKKAEILGINRFQQSPQDFCPTFNRKSALILFIFCIAYFSSVIYLFYEAEQFQEYTCCILVILTLILDIIVYLFLLCINNSLCKLYDSYEELINKSRSRHF